MWSAASSATQCRSCSNGLASKGYLKALPSGIQGIEGPSFVDADGAGAGPNTARAVVVKLTSAENGKAVCEAIKRQTGELASGATWIPVATTLATANMAKPVGCSWNSSDYYAYARF